MYEQGAPGQKSNTKSGNGRNTETLSEPPGMKLRETKPRWDLIGHGCQRQQAGLL